MKTFMMMSCWLLAVSLPALIAAAPAAAYVRILAQDCHELYRSGVQRSGVYTIFPSDSAPVEVYCDMGCAEDLSTSRGWTVIQKRMDGSISFHRDWANYKNGFGNKSGEYWLGLENLHIMTNNKPYVLEVEMEDNDGNKASARYKVFSVSSEETGYTLQVGSFVDGGAGDSLFYHNGQRFSTYDKEQNYYGNYCARIHLGGFWYNSCAYTNPNGLYMGSFYQNYYYYYYYYWGVNIWWATWRGSGYPLKAFSMKIRPLH